MIQSELEEKKKRDNINYFSNAHGLLKLVFLIETVTFPLLIISHCLCSAPFLLSHKCWVIIPAAYSLVLPICLTYHALFIFSISDYMLTDFAILIQFFTYRPPCQLKHMGAYLFKFARVVEKLFSHVRVFFVYSVCGPACTVTATMKLWHVTNLC